MTSSGFDPPSVSLCGPLQQRRKREFRSLRLNLNVPLIIAILMRSGDTYGTRKFHQLGACHPKEWPSFIRHRGTCPNEISIDTLFAPYLVGFFLLIEISIPFSAFPGKLDTYRIAPRDLKCCGWLIHPISSFDFARMYAWETFGRAICCSHRCCISRVACCRKDVSQVHRVVRNCDAPRGQASSAIHRRGPHDLEVGGQQSLPSTEGRPTEIVGHLIDKLMGRPLGHLPAEGVRPQPWRHCASCSTPQPKSRRCYGKNLV
ncbi:hypothetical protein LZ32DRAFT_221916 [Colletotrichum eremochloae]|nr:hypothetical protein LZ32DRAFT_221916 [Colletotrichum eremochloae]